MLQILVTIISSVLFAAGAYGVVSIVGFLPLLLWIANVIFSILGSLKVQGGSSYRYPFALRLIK